MLMSVVYALQRDAPQPNLHSVPSDNSLYTLLGNMVSISSVTILELHLVMYGMKVDYCSSSIRAIELKKLMHIRKFTSSCEAGV